MSNRNRGKMNEEETKVTKGSARRGKSKKANRNRKSNLDRREILDRGDRDNDPNWYFTDGTLAEQASQLSFQSVLGYGSLYGYQVPSIMKVPLVMNPGLTYDVDERHLEDPLGNGMLFWYRPAGSADIGGSRMPGILPGKAGVNLMAAKLYTTLSSFTGRTASYAPQDVAMMILAISSIAEFSEHIRRAFGLALTYNFRNRNLPLGILKTMGLDVNDFIANLSVYRMKFNVAMARINQIPLLENIAFIKKSRDIYQKVYVDDTSDMAQIFYFCPAYASILDEVGDDQGSVLRAFAVDQLSTSFTAKKMSAWLDFLNLMITNVLESSTLNFIYADLLNMANKLNVKTWKFDYLAENYVVMPEYDANAILQLHNATVVGYPSWNGSSHIQTGTKLSDNTDDKKTLFTTDDGIEVYATDGASVFCDTDRNNIVYNPYFANTGLKSYDAVIPLVNIVDMFTSNPSTVDRIEALRLAAGFSYSNIDITEYPDLDWKVGSRNASTFVYVPDHFVAAIYTYNNVDWSSANVEFASAILYPMAPATSNDAAYDAITKWHNGLLYGLTDDQQLSKLVGNVTYYTTVHNSYVKRLLEIMSVGLFDFRV